MEKPSVARHWPLGRLIVAGAVVYLMTAWLLVIAVDVLHLGGAAERFAALAGETNHPGLWMQIFKEGSVTELLQWSLLAATGFTAGVLTGRLASDGLASARPFWTLMGVAGLAMLIEDAGNPRHTVTDYVEHAAGAGLAPGLANLAFMAALAAIPLYALLRHRSAVFHVVAAKRYLIAAFAVYGAAASASAVSALGTVYEGIGSFLEQTLFQGRLLTNPAFETTRSQGLPAHGQPRRGIARTAWRRIATCRSGIVP